MCSTRTTDAERARQDNTAHIDGLTVTALVSLLGREETDSLQDWNKQGTQQTRQGIQALSTTGTMSNR